MFTGRRLIPLWIATSVMANAACGLSSTGPRLARSAPTPDESRKAPAMRPPLSIDVLRATRFSVALKYVRKLEDGAGFTADLVSYRSAGLTVYAMVATPRSEPPPKGFPLIVANHGTHPNPPKYGITADGIDSRPGDYYRPIPELYTQQGFIVVMPDYRGHNISEGVEFTRGFLANSYYTEDVLALLSGLSEVRNADLDRVFMWGHSLGGEVSLRTLLATNQVKGASLWSTVGGDVWDQAYHYSRYKDQGSPDSSETPKVSVDQLRMDITRLGVPYDWASREPLRHLGALKTPLIIHHSIDDGSAAYKWSVQLAKELYLLGRPYRFYSYPGSDHFFGADARQLAVERDVAFFKSLTQ